MSNRNHRIVLSIAIGALVTVSACTKANDESTTEMSRGTVATDTMAVAPTGGAWTDANIAAILDAASASDSSFGAMAVAKTARPDVKQFAQLMMTEHHALRLAGQQLVQKLGVTPILPAGFDMPDDQRDAMADLQKKTGADFDKDYINHEVDYHQDVLDTAKDALSKATNQELKDLITKAAPIIQKHLDHAKQLQAAMTG